MSRHDKIHKVLTEGIFEEFVGWKEDLHFEVKNSVAYDFETPTGRYELAKDVSSFANSEGGYLVFGLREERQPNERSGVVKSVNALKPEEFDIDKLRGLIKSHIWPDIKGLEIRWWPSSTNKSLGLGSIYVPTQIEATKLFLITKVAEGNQKIKEIVVGIAKRNDSDNIPLTSSEIYDLIREGHDTVINRTKRIEDKLDALIRHTNGRFPPSKVISNRVLGSRVKIILDE